MDPVVSAYRRIYQAIRDHQGLGGVALRLLKLSEEVGEVSEAYIGVVGGNKRKGFSHCEYDVAKELADVAITAMVALHDWTSDPEGFLADRIRQIEERIREEGS